MGKARTQVRLRELRVVHQKLIRGFTSGHFLKQKVYGNTGSLDAGLAHHYLRLGLTPRRELDTVKQHEPAGL